MGSYSVCCSLTNTGIEAGDQIVLIAFKRKPNAYGILQKIAAYEERRDGPSTQNPVLCVLRGTYNDYGWVEDVPPPKDLDRDYIAYFHATLVEHGTPLDLALVKKLARACWLARRPLISSGDFGPQFIEREEVELQLKLTETAQFILSQRMKIIESQDEEEWPTNP